MWTHLLQQTRSKMNCKIGVQWWGNAFPNNTNIILFMMKSHDTNIILVMAESNNANIILVMVEITTQRVLFF